MVGGWLTCVAFCVTKKMWTLLIKLRHILRKMRPLHCGAFCVTHAESVICFLFPLVRKTSDRSGQNRLSNEPLHPTITETESQTKNDTKQWATPSTNQNRKRIRQKKRNKPLYPSNQNRKRIRDRYGQRRLRNEPFYPAKAMKQKLLVKITSTEKGKGCIFIMLSKFSPFKDIYSASNISQGLKKLIYVVKDACF